jgi:hypothetical protein
MKMRAAPVCLIQARPPERNPPGVRPWSAKATASTAEEGDQEIRDRRSLVLLAHAHARFEVCLKADRERLCSAKRRHLRVHTKMRWRGSTGEREANDARPAFIALTRSDHELRNPPAPRGGRSNVKKDRFPREYSTHSADLDLRRLPTTRGLL